MALLQTVNPATSTGTITATTAQTAQDSLILVFIGTSALTDTVATVTDNGSNTYIKAYGVASGTGGDTECWYSQKSSPTTSVVVTFSAGITTKSVIVREYSGMWTASALDATVSTSGSGTSVSSGASSATTDAAELVVCSCSCLGTSPTLSVGAGYGNYTSQALLAGASLHSVEDKTVAAIGAQTGTMTAGGTLPVWDVGTATFRIVIPNIITNYQFVDAPNGISVTEKVR